MLKNFLLIISGIYCTWASAQTSSTSFEFEGQINGGKEEFDQVLQTQLTLPKTLLVRDFKQSIISYFNVDSSGKAVSIKFEGLVNNALRNELERMFLFFTFRRTLNLPNEERPYFIQFDVSTEKYHKYIKQKKRFNIKKTMPADSSYVTYSRANRSPEYYKNGEAGMNEYILNEIEYPQVARERSIQGTVILEFIVETNGYVTDINVKQAVNGGCTEEAVRLIKTTRWQPAEQGNKLVRYKMSYPITFNLSIGKSNFRTAESIGN